MNHSKYETNAKAISKKNIVTEPRNRTPKIAFELDTSNVQPIRNPAGGHLKKFIEIKEVEEIMISNYKTTSGILINLIYDKVVGGTKVRGLIPFMEEKSLTYSEVSYSTLPEGAGQVALTIAALKVGKLPVIFVTERSVSGLSDNSRRVKDAGGILKEINQGRLKTLRTRETEYVNSKVDKCCYSFSFGMRECKPQLTENLKSLFSRKLENLEPRIKRLWVVVGSGLIFESLADATPDEIRFVLVVPGFDSKKYKLTNEYTHRVDKVHTSQLSFTEEAYAPFECNNFYEGKAWKFINDDGLVREGDYLWVV